jgi:multidrug efflux pump subunit AcrA (membrane-fusion protein)
MKTWIWRNGLSLVAVLLVVLGTAWAVRRLHTPGQLDVLSAQAMDMSQMRPPTGAALVALASVRRGSLGDAVTYTGTVRAYNEQEISPRIVGTLIALPVYPGDPVRAGQVVAQLDTAEVGAKADRAARQAQEAEAGAQVADLNHRLHHQAALDQSSAQVQVAQQGVADAQAEAQSARDAVTDADAAVGSASANAGYWQTEIAREKQLADAGAASRQEYQNELAQAQVAFAALTSARAKARGARAMAHAAQAKVQGARRQVEAAQAGRQMAEADLAVAQGQAAQARAGASAAQAAARESAIVQGYARITSPATGIVTARPVAPGTLVQPGTTILRVAELDRVRVQASVAASDLTSIEVGTPVQITAGAAQSIAARVTAVFPSANDETRTAVVEAVIPNPGRRLRPGAFVTVRIAAPAALGKLLVPAAAVITSGGASQVWVAQGAAGAAKPAVYQCEKCHMTYSAVDAAKRHFIDPMDGGRLVAMPPAPRSGADGTAHQVAVQTGASDGAWTEIMGGGLHPGDQVVTHGQAGLTEGARLVPTAWGPDGPKSLPTAAVAGHGRKVYRCEKCGMTYSEADAQRNHFVDPMDGGKLNPVEVK